MRLVYSALSPFCRKVRMAMEMKGLRFELLPGDHVSEAAAFNERAEVPMLIDGDLVVSNSADILGYVDRKHPLRPLYPAEPADYADVRAWERLSDTHLDAIVTVIGNWAFATLPEIPAGLLDAAKRDAVRVYDRMEDRLATHDYVCGAVSAADYALYPHVGSGHLLGLPFDRDRHPGVRAWLKRMRARPEGESDLAAARDWWANRDRQTVDTERVNWGSFRLEWLVANGGADFFADQVRNDKVLFSVGPRNNAKNNPVAPAWAR